MKENKNYISTSRRNIGLANELDLGKLPPQALDLEESVLGALMLEKDALTDVIDILKKVTSNKKFRRSKQNLFFIPPDLVQRQTPRALVGAKEMCGYIDKAREN